MVDSEFRSHRTPPESCRALPPPGPLAVASFIVRGREWKGRSQEGAAPQNTELKAEGAVF